MISLLLPLIIIFCVFTIIIFKKNISDNPMILIPIFLFGLIMIINSHKKINAMEHLTTADGTKDIYIPDLISAEAIKHIASLYNTEQMTIKDINITGKLTLGNGLLTIDSNGNINTNGTILAKGDIASKGAMAVNGSIVTNGNLEAPLGNITTKGFIAANGNITANGSITTTNGNLEAPIGSVKSINVYATGGIEANGDVHTGNMHVNGGYMSFNNGYYVQTEKNGSTYKFVLYNNEKNRSGSSWNILDQR